MPISELDKNEFIYTLQYVFYLAVTKGYCKKAEEFVGPFLSNMSLLAPGKAYRKEERDMRSRLYQKRMGAGLCSVCGKNPIAYERSRRVCEVCLDRAKEYARKSRELKK